jgi:hypothetical protein
MRLSGMITRVAADFVVIIHFGFIVFVVLGGFLVLRWPKLMWLHLPAVAWGVVIEFAGFICPLTPLENRLRITAGEGGYSSGFIDQYLIPVVYPDGLNRSTQIALGVLLVSINLVLYCVVAAKRKRNKKNA